VSAGTEFGLPVGTQPSIMVILIIFLLSVTSSQVSCQDNGGGRKGRQNTGGEIEEGCTTTGYEKQYRELCEEEFENVCKNVTGVEYKKEIVTRCDTRLEQQCNTTVRAVPREVCVERNRTECFPDIHIVPETTFTSECENIVQHVCEEHYNVPVPVQVPVPVAAPIPVPKPTQVHVPMGPDPDPQAGLGYKVKRQTPAADNVLFQLKQALRVAPPPEIFQEEIPAPPGCRSLVTQKCRKVPIPRVKKVPDEKCEEVPGVKCYLELVDVHEPVCKLVPMEECVDELLETPFLTVEEECEDVAKLVCTEIEEQVPIQVCKTIDVLRTPIITGKGRVREVSDIKGIGVRAKVVGRLPNITDVGGDRGRRGRLLRDQPLTRLTKGGRSSKSREERMRSIIKKLLSN